MTTQINCLRCKACELLPETNMREARPLIFCGKMDTKREMNLHGCPVANPQTPYIGHGWKAIKTGGDKTRQHSAVEIAFLEVRYPVAEDLRALARLVGRHRDTLKSLASRHGWKRLAAATLQARSNGVQAARRRCRASGTGNVFNAAQHEYLLERHARNDWPTRGGNRHASRRAINQALRDEIVADVARMGQPRTWSAIQSYVCRQSPGHLRWRREYYRRRKMAASA